MKRVLLSVAGFVLAASACGGEFVIARRGCPANVPIALSTDATPSFRYAAEELRDHVKGMTDVELAIAENGRRGVFLEKGTAELGDDGFRIRSGADGVHIFGYHGVPDTYRILMVTKSGQVFLSGVCARTVLQSSATVDWAAKTVTRPPTWVGYVLQFLATFVPTILVEGILLLLFGYGTQRRNWLRFLTVNLLTQGTLALAMAYSAMQHGVTGWSLLPFILMEILITIGEAALYSHLLTGHSRGRAVLYGLAANLCSALLGLHLAEPVWKFVVSIS